MITTSKYEENGFADIIAGLVKIYNPKIVVELGTQQGASAIIIAKALKDGYLFTYDNFTFKYPHPPYAETHADFGETLENLHTAGVGSKVSVEYSDALEVHKNFQTIDMLHIDLCNHYDNISPLLLQWRNKVIQVIILEGGGHNKWQKEYGFKPFTPLLREYSIEHNYDVTILKKDENYALTILVKKNV